MTGSGDGDRQMSQYEVHLYLESRGQPQHDLEIVADAIQADPAPLTPDFTKSGAAAARAILAPSKTTTKNAHGVEVSDDDIPF